MPVLKISEVECGATLGIWQVEERVEELEKMLPDLAESEVYLGFHHNLRRLEWLGARALMREMGLSWALSYTEHGKPFYPDGPKISLTHSKDYIAIITHPSKEVGIDVQEMVPKVERIKLKYCNTFELEWAKSLEDYSFIWSAKEAMFKVKERNVHFARDIKVFPADGDEMKVLFKETEEFTGIRLNLEGYSGVFI